MRDEGELLEDGMLHDDLPKYRFSKAVENRDEATAVSYTFPGSDRYDGELVPDLSKGFFAYTPEWSDDHQALAWVPYADQHEAIVVYPPTRQNNGISAEVVEPGEPDSAEDYYAGAVAESLDYFLPFGGFHGNTFRPRPFQTGKITD